jgi:hypothetical protein
VGKVFLYSYFVCSPLAARLLAFTLIWRLLVLLQNWEEADVDKTSENSAKTFVLTEIEPFCF